MQFRFVNPKWKLNPRPSWTPSGSATLKGSPMSQLVSIWNPNVTSRDFHGLGGLTSQTKFGPRMLGCDGNSAKKMWRIFPTVLGIFFGENQLKSSDSDPSPTRCWNIGINLQTCFCLIIHFSHKMISCQCLKFVPACALWNTTVGTLMDLEGSQNTR